MHVHAFDQYREGGSLLHRLDARVKVLAAVGFILSNAFLPDGSWAAFLLSWLVLLVANALSDLGVAYTLRRSFVALPFALAAVSAIFSPLGEPLARWTFLGLTLVPTDFGVFRFLSILLRSWLSVQWAILLVATTTFPDMLHAFEHLRAPRVLTSTIAFLYRYLFVLADEAFRLLRARQARSARLDGKKSGGGLLWRIRVTGNMAGQLFLRSYERSDRVYQAMLARGYSGYLRTLNPHQLKRQDYLALGVVAVIILLIQLQGWVR